MHGFNPKKNPQKSHHNQQPQPPQVVNLNAQRGTRDRHGSVRPPWWRSWSIMAFYRCRELLGGEVFDFFRFFFGRIRWVFRVVGFQPTQKF